MDSTSVLEPTVVLNFVIAGENIQETSRVGGTNGYQHVSSLVSLNCARKACIVHQHAVLVSNPATAAHRVMWAQGRASENHVRDSIIKATGGSVVFGVWTCACGEAQHVGLKPASDFVCARCARPVDRYRELTVFDHHRKITANPDIMLMLNGKVLVVEIKSVASDAFKELTGPLGDHQLQALLYHRVLSENGYALHDRVAIIYVRKGFLWTGSNPVGKIYHEFHVDVNSTTSLNMVEDRVSLAETIARANAAGVLPSRTVCSSPDSPSAKTCPVSHLCFNLPTGVF
jgi:hypothetical protein